MRQRGTTTVCTAIAVAAAFTLSACTEPTRSSVEISTGKAPGQDVVAAPEGSVETALQELPDIVAAALKSSNIPGMAVAVTHKGRTVFAQGYGVRKLGEAAVIDPGTVFQIASLSKPLGATVVASQVSKGVLGWETPIATLMPSFTLSDPWVSKAVTVGDVYSHRSGLPKAAGDSLEDIGYGRAEILERLALVPLDPFRITYNYANFGMTAGAEAVAMRAGVAWEDLARDELYAPLGMGSTSSSHTDFLARDNRATLHAKTSSGFAALYERDADAQSPAGGVSSSVQDLANWMELVLGQGTWKGRELIKAQALLPAISAQTTSGHSAFPDQRAGNYGFGFNVGTQPGGRVSLGHSGAFVLGAGTAMTMIPSLDLGIVVLTNAAPLGVAEAVAAGFMDYAQFGASHRDWVRDYAGALAGLTAPAGDLVDATAPTNPAPSTALDSLLGSYVNAYHGPATVTFDAGKLTVALGPSGTYVLALEHWDANTFAFVPTGENAPAGSRSSATFAQDAVGRPTLRLEFFDSQGLGTWVRQ
ncbi:serine hydrolase [Arthrobacter sp. HLT1-20]